MSNIEHMREGVRHITAGLLVAFSWVAMIMAFPTAGVMLLLPGSVFVLEFVLYGLVLIVVSFFERGGSGAQA